MKNRIVYSPSGGGKKRRELRTMIAPIALGTGVLLICGGIIFALRAPRLQIRNIALSGIKTLDEKAVHEGIRARLAGTRGYVFLRSSFFLADTGAIASGLKQDFPRIRDVAVAKKFPDKLNIVITERAFWGVFCNGLASSSTPACAFIDPDGIAYEHAPKPQGKLIITIRTDTDREIALGSPAVDPALMAGISALTENIPAQTGIALADFELRGRVPREIRVIAADGFTMIFNLESDYAAVLRVLKRVLDGEIKDKRIRLDYIDLRFGNKVFYKMK